LSIDRHPRDVRDVEKEIRNRLIDGARTYLIFLAGHQAKIAEALDGLARQAHGNADRLREAAEQLRRRFPGADAISLLEAAAERAEDVAEPELPILIEPPNASTGELTPPQAG